MFNRLFYQSFALKPLKNVAISTFPPLIIQQTFLPLNRLSLSTAATTVAHDG
jgi:hypothetical protein